MSIDGWKRLLVLGGIGSGRSEFALSLLQDQASVRRVAAEEFSADPSELAQLLRRARADETLLVEGLDAWVRVLLDPAHQPADDRATVAELAGAVGDCAARVVLVAPEAGLGAAPAELVERAFADALGTTNRTVADACDAVVLVIAGQPSWLKVPQPATGDAPAGFPAAARPGARPGGTGAGASGVTGAGAPAVASVGIPSQPRQAPAAVPVAAAAPTLVSAPVADLDAAEVDFAPGMDLPMPDDTTGPQAVARLADLDLAGTGFGDLSRLISFAAATQATPVPTAWDRVRVLLVQGEHDGGLAAGHQPQETARRLGQATDGTGALGQLAAAAGADLQVVSAPPAAPIEFRPALDEATVEAALRTGWELARQAAADGVRLLVLAAVGTGTDGAAAAVLAATAGTEPPMALARVVGPGGRVDDTAWIRRCTAVRDALHRSRYAGRSAREVLAELGGGDIAVATGVLLSAAAHRLPVLLDGPVGIAAGMVSRDLGSQARHWCLLVDDGGHPGVRVAAEVLGLTPLMRLGLDLGEGANALAALPMLRSALALAAALPPHPQPAATDAADEPAESDGTGEDAEPAGAEPEFAEPAPQGPGPATTQPQTEPESGVGQSAGRTG